MKIIVDDAFSTIARLFAAMLAFLAIGNITQANETNEFRGLWVDAFHDGFKTPAQVTTLLRDVRDANFNAIVVQVRRRGDVFYNSSIEPKANEVAADFDPLADILKKAHDTNDGPRIEVHAWIVVYPVANRQAIDNLPTNHPARLHREWFSKDVNGETWDGHNYGFEQGLPQVQNYLVNLSMEIISKYDVDGFHLDHIRYDKNTWGYHDEVVQRFNQQYNRTGKPKPTDPEWMNFRREQVTALVRRIYLSAIALKPQIKISAACNSRAPGICTTADWPRSASYSSTLQDWRAWMEEGILDMVIPMTYFNQDKWGSAWANWSIFEKDHRYNRHVIMGPGPYQNTISNSLYQLQSSRQPTAEGNRADGMCLYCYAVLSKEGTKKSQRDFLNALVKPSVYSSKPLFPTPVSTPVMSWKSFPTLGFVKGFARSPSNDKRIEGIKILLSGPKKVEMTSDANGFYGGVDLPPGEYAISATIGGKSFLTNCVIRPGIVTTQDF